MSGAPKTHPYMSYLVGFALAVVLTAIPFALVAMKSLALIPTMEVIGVLGLVQAVVHLRCFLHLDLRPHSRERLIALAFAAVIVFIMAGGTFWIMTDLNARMGMGM